MFWPLAAIMGVELEDADKVASLLGTKVFVDEFISFMDLGNMIKANEIAVCTFFQTPKFYTTSGGF